METAGTQEMKRHATREWFTNSESPLRISETLYVHAPHFRYPLLLLADVSLEKILKGLL